MHYVISFQSLSSGVHNGTVYTACGLCLGIDVVASSPGLGLATVTSDVGLGLHNVRLSLVTLATTRADGFGWCLTCLSGDFFIAWRVNCSQFGRLPGENAPNCDDWTWLSCMHIIMLVHCVSVQVGFMQNQFDCVL